VTLLVLSSTIGPLCSLKTVVAAASVAAEVDSRRQRPGCRSGCWWFGCQHQLSLLNILTLLLLLVLQLRPDGTVQAAAGGSVASTNAISNPLLNILTQGAYDNRPEASSTAYTQIPLLLGEHKFEINSACVWASNPVCYA
jgi:hypothetical protein